MNKREFLKRTGLLGAATLLPFERLLSASGNSTNRSSNVCTLIPSETAGPFPLDLTTNTYYFRQDVRESKPGTQLNLRLKITGDGNCLPMQNIRVNIWHCDKDGLYSGYDQTNNVGQSGLTYLRGYQMTDSNGEVEFITIFPGWYTGRICHIHFQVYVSSNYSAVSQLTFDLAAKNAVYAANPGVYTKGADPLGYSQDNVFSDGYTLQLGTLTPNAATGGYDSYMEVTVQGSGTTGLGHIEKENAKQFSLRQNFPNPFEQITTIPFTLIKRANAKLILFDLQGRIVKTFTKENLGAGEYSFEIDFSANGIAKGNYGYQLEVTNADGTYRDCKLMTGK
jgi:protocatechuate 3,4-dioxygenase beta subunit